MPAKSRPAPALYTPTAAPETLPLPIALTEVVNDSRYSPIALTEVCLVDRSKKVSYRKVPYATRHSSRKQKSRSRSSIPKEGSESSSNEPDIVPKPPGEPGRPRRGGYSLEPTLRPLFPKFDELRDYIKDLTERDLDPTKTITRQSPSALIVVEEKCLLKYPELKKFQFHWPVEAFLKTILAGSAQRHREMMERSGTPHEHVTRSKVTESGRR